MAGWGCASRRGGEVTRGRVGSNREAPGEVHRRVEDGGAQGSGCTARKPRSRVEREEEKDRSRFCMVE